MIRRSAALFIVLGLATAACASDDATPATTATDPATTTPATDAPDTTPAPTTSTSSTAAPTTTTTVAPTTTLDPIAETEAAVKQARLDGEQAIFEAEADPENQPLRDVIAEFNTGDRLQQTFADIDGLLEDGLAVRRGEPNLSRIVFTGTLQFIDDEPTEVFLEECAVNSDVAYVVPLGGEPEVVVDDRVFTYIGEVRYLFEDDQWKNAGGTLIERIVGSDQCPDQ